MIWKAFQQIFLCTALLSLGLTFVYFQLETNKSASTLPDQVASNTYLGPIKPAPGTDKLIRLEVLVRDSPQANGLQIVSVTFDDTDIPLKPRDIYGNRGNASFQVKPGVYKLRGSSTVTNLHGLAQ